MIIEFAISVAVLYLLYKIATTLLGVVGKRLSEPPPPPVPAGVKAVRDVEFTQTPQGPLKLDIYIPETLPEKPLPVLIHFFGGGWIMGNKNQIRFYDGQNYALHGFAVISIDYRLSDVAKFPAQLHDCKAAIRWVRKHAGQYHFDPHHIGVFGGSAGGYMSSMIGVTGSIEELEGVLPPDDAQYAGPVQAVVPFIGPSDMSQMDAQRLRFGRRYDREKSMVTDFLGGVISDVPELVQKANPISYIKPGMPPFLIIHGDKDKIVPVGQSQILHEALVASEVESELLIVEGAGHGSMKAYRNEKIFEKVKGFFNRHLKT